MIILAAVAHLFDLGTYLIMGEAFEMNPLVPRVELFAIFAKLALIAFVGAVAVLIHAMGKYKMVSWGLLQFAFASGAFAASTNIVVILT